MPDAGSPGVALVTGGASGIGRGAALELARHFRSVVVADLAIAAAEGVAEEIRSAGGTALAVAVDVGDESEVTAMVDRAVAAFGQIDVLVHSAGVLGRRRPILEMTDQEWRSLLDVNLSGTFYVSRAVGRHMAGRGSGTVILLASDRGVYGAREKAHYAASKGAVIAYMKSFALELGQYGVTCNAINPGTTQTPGLEADTSPEHREARAASDPLGRISTPDDIAKVVLFLAAGGGSFITGQLFSTRMRVA
ncbi:SDR family NAD(P)-dependent oxidoreductase [Amycolatopsis jejuensis]|uniref:SDR family NAD(P)-dependent oxidoreductase n=1 Tax=Amycolatopsis jejuensis TaxID=330084 RepID=UPI0005265B4F|nr:SDR family NAD(P)-dependent oxidoreductase [Amycolatopsis jejuensis]